MGLRQQERQHRQVGLLRQLLVMGLVLASLLLVGFGAHADHGHAPTAAIEAADDHGHCPPGPDGHDHGCIAAPAAHMTCCAALPIEHAHHRAPPGTRLWPHAEPAFASLPPTPPSRPPIASSAL